MIVLLGRGRWPPSCTRRVRERAADPQRPTSMGRLGLVVVVAVGAAGSASFAGCSDSQPAVAQAVVTYARGLPPSGAMPPSAVRPRVEPWASVAFWAGPRRIYVVTYGSSSCPRLPTSVRPDGEH